ncbi:uncharacterized protein LOC114936705 [Nylanderia fulva]|uniref:uncharacterized protein LOC114936705 n=1 Tax=Nylanderia fulva TaxID=613905 RepID=UPI0010FB3BEC|nr:uncharacterized protein LOC114936705 [Nylanderia fulva]
MVQSASSLNGAPNGEGGRGGGGEGEGERTSNVITVDGESSSTSSLTRGTGNRFSLFRWFRSRNNRDSTVEKRRRTDGVRRSSVYSSAESVDTFYSTTTVRSFAFHAGTLDRCDVQLSLDILGHRATEVGPFAAGASKVGNKENTNAAACTLPINVHSRRRNITARYSLHPSTTFASCENFPSPEKASRTGGRRIHVKGKRRAPNPPAVIKIVEVDVRETPARNSNRRKRRAPQPPERSTNHPSAEEQSGRSLIINGGDGMELRNVEERQSISNDTLVLQGGMLLSKKEVRGSPKAAKSNKADDPGSSVLNPREKTTRTSIGSTLAMPRPWYKRSVFEHSSHRDAGSFSRKGGPATSGCEMREKCVGTSASYSVDSTSRLSFFHRDDKKRQEAKRRSGLSILTNISELDKEAAAIVQEEQARARASMLLKTSKFADEFERRSDVNEELVQDMVTSAMENASPRRGARALISKFNAISNITKVTVNANFFAKRDQSDYKLERDVTRSRFEQMGDWRSQRFSAQQDLGQNIRVDRDISRYFLPQQRSSRNEAKLTDINSVDVKTTSSKELSERTGANCQNDQLMREASDRISFLQSQLAANRASESLAVQKDIALLSEEKIRVRQEIAEEKGKGSPRLNSETGRKFLLSRARNLVESMESALDSERDIRTKGTGRQKEFSNIFDEIDRKLRSRELKLGEERKDRVGDKVPEDEAVSSRVAKVLDILVEAEKDGRTRSAAQPGRSMRDKETSRLINSSQQTESGKTKSTVLNTVEDPITVDLKEMLKEMKHSLPKRPKSRKPMSSDVDAVVLEKADKPVSASKSSDYEADKQKVSSSAQTSGNIRRLNQPSTSADARPSTSAGWKHENVLYRTSGKGSALVKNTFQLIRPRDFAEIEATKTTREIGKENTYANMMEPSLYANAHVPPTFSPKQSSPNSTPSKDISRCNHVKASPNIVNESKMLNDEEFVEEDDNSAAKNMNTLDINRLLRKLEGAIASGHHQQAAGLAKELARLKIHCSVIRQRSAARLKDQSIKVNMYIEDKLAHQGPIPLQLPTRMMIAELKTKVQTEFEIPTNVQRWIIGKNLADHDEATLDELHAVDGSPVFLYLVAPELHVDNTEPNKPTVEDKVLEELPEDPPTNLQIIEEAQETVETEEATNEHEGEPAETDVSEDVKMARYEELISLENWDVIPNSESIECPICFVTYGPREGVILRDCLHMFCRPCIANTIAYCEEAEVKCPYRDVDYTCESTLQEREIKALVEPEVYQQHLAKSITQAENNAGNKAFHCKTPDCPGWCIYDDDVNNFLCPVCGANNCLTCQVVHAGKNCKQYQQELQFSKETDQESRRTAAMLKEMVDRGEALACPTCAVVLMKKWGCDWLVCSMCKTEICWVTRGPRWGPGGKGDTSGGCKCGENGVKCHPRCNYCH